MLHGHLGGGERPVAVHHRQDLGALELIVPRDGEFAGGEGLQHAVEDGSRVVVATADGPPGAVGECSEKMLIHPPGQVPDAVVGPQTKLIRGQVEIRELDSRQRRNPLVGKVQELRHRELHPGERRNIVIVKRSSRRGFRDPGVALQEHLERAGLEITGRKRGDRGRALAFRMGRKMAGVVDAVSSDMNHDLQGGSRGDFDPTFHQSHSLRDGQGGTLARAAANKGCGDSIAEKALGLSFHDVQIECTIGVERRVGRDDQPVEGALEGEWHEGEFSWAKAWV